MNSRHDRGFTYLLTDRPVRNLHETQRRAAARLYRVMALFAFINASMY